MMINVSSLFRPSWIFYLLWMLMNLWLFWNTFRLYKGQPQYYYIHQMLGSGLCISRGSGAVLNLSCGLVLLPACKRAATFLRRWMSPAHHRIRTIVFNQAERFHITCAVTIVIAGVIHTAAHVANVVNFSRHYNPVWTEINMAEYPGQDPLLLVIATVPGVTGLLMLLILVVILVTSGRWFRTRHFNVFYYIHNFLFGPFFLLLVFHPIRTDQLAGSSTRSREGQSVQPIFAPVPNNTWLWVSIPLLAYVADWILRKFVRRRPASIVQAIHHKSANVLELVIERHWICKSQPGQYVLLQCPAVSGFEWHPFSISSCCDLTHPNWTVHVRTGGDWCNQLRDLVISRGKVRKMHDDVELYVDGPFTSPLEDVLKSRTAICIAGGIGLTPFLSIFHHLIRNGWQSRPDRLHVVWCVPTIESLSWASAAIDRLIEDAWASARPDKFEVVLYVTRQRRKGRLSSLSNKDMIQFPNILRRIEFGRPNWTETFASWADIYPDRRVNVFSCGPRSLNRQIERLCRPRSNFILSLEQFS